MSDLSDGQARTMGVQGRTLGGPDGEAESVTPGMLAAEVGAEEFSVLELRDRVVIMLLFDQIVSEERVAEVWAWWQQEFGGDPKQPLWRLLTLIPELDRELIFAEAARVYGIEEARITRLGALHIIEKISRVVPRSLWDKMVALRMVPIDEGEQNHSHRRRLIFATHDPTHPEVQALMPQFKLDGYELRYAPETEIVDLLAEAFPWKYKALKTALEAERALIAHTAARIHQDEHAGEAAAPGTPADRLEDKALEAPVNSSSIINLFEDVLVEAVRREAEGVCIVPNEHGAAAIYFQADEDLDQWRVVDHIDSQALLATIKSVVIRADFAAREDTQKQLIKRWIDGKLVRFRVSALPWKEKLNLESIVVRVLK